ncbi:MAG: major facilitator superfamily 1 [Tardiphaga sp.]|nr:major facilitator superfamily 1 [Tardiphaga sp.]
MNKPVIITEDTTMAPVVVEAPVAPPGALGPDDKQTLAPTYAVIFAISLSHFLNDLMQSLIPSLYPILKTNYALDFGQIGMITLAFQFTSSLLQPLVGIYTDRQPRPYSLAMGMTVTLAGLLLLSVASSYPLILAAAALVGTGSAIFHPESSRIARLASGGRYGFAQSVFQVGGNFGTALGPLMAALIVVPLGQHSVAGFSLVAALAIFILWRIGGWYKPRIVPRAQAKAIRPTHGATPARVRLALVILVVMLFSKTFYTASITSYYTFYLMHKFALPTQTAQLYLFVFLAASAVGVFFGGPLGDRFGRKYVIWFSILGVLPFTLALPYANLPVSVALSIVIGFILSSAMPAVIVYAQELMPHRLGMISGLFFGFGFGLGGIGAAVLGEIADIKGIDYVYQLCAFLPAIGLLAIFLPKMPRVAR